MRGPQKCPPGGAGVGPIVAPAGAVRGVFCAQRRTRYLAADPAQGAGAAAPRRQRRRGGVWWQPPK